jgi:basic membrane lipoprotein Med (substrate-binding protein (PBP1-ABC) superfamily)
MTQDRRATAVKGRTTRPSTPAGWPARASRALRGLRGRRVAVAAAAVFAAAAIAVWAAIATSGPKPRTRQYLTFKACLLTDAQGVAGKQAAPVWAGMEKASLKTRAKVQNLPAFGPPTTANALPYLRTLIGQQCNMIIAVGAGPVAAVVAEASAHQKTQFLIAGNASTAHNITVINPDSTDVSTAISDALIHQVRAH